MDIAASLAAPLAASQSVGEDVNGSTEADGESVAENQPIILIVDDNLDNLCLLFEMLGERHYGVRRAINGPSALRGAQKIRPDLVLLDINMPEMDGYEVCRQLKASEQTRDIPVIFMSALASPVDKVRAFQAGGVDYINKPFQIEEVVVRIQTQLMLQQAQAEVKSLNRDLEKRIAERTRELALEIAERKLAQEQLAYMAWHDSLTDLPNRAWLMEQLETLMNQTHRQPEQQFALLFLDCDRFKIVNDSLGHHIGDQLLISVAQRLTQCLPSGTSLARLGGDEFTVLLENVQALSEAEALAQTIQNSLTDPFQLAQYEFSISASIGIVLGTAAYEQAEDLLRDADIAMYAAKAEGKGNYKLFDQEMHDRALQGLHLESELQQAVERQEFTLVYQPIVALKDGSISGCEALVRWRHPQHGLVSPDKFIPIAEETGLIVPLGAQVMLEACRQLKIWQQLYDLSTTEKPFQFQVSVNLSVKQFAQHDLLAQIDRILEETGLDRQGLKLEITESAIMGEPDFAAELLQQLKVSDISLAIDDFGTGYSSLSYLRQFPTDTLKIDRSFVNRIDQSLKDREIVHTIVNLAQTLGMNVVAEGIETEAQRAYLQEMGCELGQGYLLAKPMDAISFGKLLSPQKISLHGSQEPLLPPSPLLHPSLWPRKSAESSLADSTI